mgnify:CR=1 FL=1
MASDGGSADVEPVLVVRRELLASAGLDDVDPDGDLELACAHATRGSQSTRFISAARGARCSDGRKARRRRASLHPEERTQHEAACAQTGSIDPTASHERFMPFRAT